MNTPKAWAVILPHVPVPSAADTAPWQQLSELELDRAILRCSRRYAASMIRNGFRPVDAYRYVTFVANEAVKAARANLLATLQVATPPVTDGAEADDNIGNRA